MENHFYKGTGISLISGSLLIFVTMVLHPLGGSMEYIIRISDTIMVTHALAIFCLPIVLFGFYGLTIKLIGKWKLSVLAFIIITFGLIAAMFAALVNGLTLPHFLGHYSDNIEQNASVLKPIVNYGFAINEPLDYIFITACCLAVVIYSSIIIRSDKFPKWIGYFGILIIVCTIIGVLTGYAFTSLTGFRVFTFSLAGWILSSGILLIKSK